MFYGKTKIQNAIILIASYIFYGWWDWRFLLLLLVSTLIDFFFGLIIHSNTGRKKLIYLWLCILNNLGILFVFKYYNFFIESFTELSQSIGFNFSPYFISIALPVGISFYTFHGMSYVFDIYRDKAVPTRNFINYAGFVCFFPLLVAGPIERASNLLPQFIKARKFTVENLVNGFRLILWGYFKKVVIADNSGILASDVFNQYGSASSFELILGAFFFAFQIYCDFSGYSDIAMGVARLFGFELLINFRTPYFSRDIAEFWRRWHISLSSWFKDYLYIPLGGSKNGIAATIRNTIIIFVISGLWHGANWTFIAWGLLNALYFIPLFLMGRNRNNMDHAADGKLIPSFREIVGIFTTFTLTCFAWIFFKSTTINDAFSYIHKIFVNHNTGINLDYKQSLVLVLIFILIDWLFRTDVIPFKIIKSRGIRFSSYIIIFTLICLFGSFINKQDFIYFQF
ncbi:MBOAT family O-acyltransferase [Pedobacter nyackensis]|nr:MBOAT family O-acyltransferase [Pedobacter nyackensis]